MSAPVEIRGRRHATGVRSLKRSAPAIPDDPDDIAIAAPGNLRFPAKILIFRPRGFPSPEPTPPTGGPIWGDLRGKTLRCSPALDDPAAELARGANREAAGWYFHGNEVDLEINIL
jgi:hypothetical protein